MMTCGRRQFLQVLGATGAIAPSATLAAAPIGPRRPPALAPGRADVESWRAQFPALRQSVNGQPLAYLDSAATTLRPRAVIDAMARFQETDNANPSAAAHTLARRAAEHYAGARQRVASFLNAADASEIVFTKGTTEGVNLVAATWAAANLRAGDEILLTTSEHYSNLLPWRQVAERTGARIRTVDVDDEGNLSPSRIAGALTDRTRLLAFTHVSNVLGIVNPAAEICAIARRRGVLVFVDGAQSAPHLRLDVRAIGCDFLAWSAHKLLGPMGVGVLWARRDLLDAMPPYQTGSNMAHEVDDASAQLEHGALKYQAGTPNVSGPLGLASALDVLDTMGFDAIARHDRQLVEHASRRFAEVEGLRVLGTLRNSSHRVPLFTFTLKQVPVPRIVAAMDAAGIAIRGGDMAALPLLTRFGVRAAARASCYLYTTTGEIDRFVEVLRLLTREG
jgi:cysteine desulfurase/selenocysteine lyase